MKNDKDIKDLLKNILKYINVSFDDIEVSLDKIGKKVFSIKTKEGPLLIGPQGEHFLALSHLVKKIVSPQQSEPINFSIDVNDYQSKQIEVLKRKALVLAERAKSFGTEVSMEPMSSYERMLVHSLFSEDSNIETRSEGLGRERHVVISFAKKQI